MKSVFTLHVKQGTTFRVETVDWTGGQIHDDDSADDVKNVDLSQAIPFSSKMLTNTNLSP